MAEIIRLQDVPDLTTTGIGVHPDAEPLVYERPRIEGAVPGSQWAGEVAGARAILRLPAPDCWNGKLMIGATPAVRSERSLDLLLSDLVIQRGYAFAACDKGTPGLALRDPSRSMAEWVPIHRALTEFAVEQAAGHYGRVPDRVYISGVSNGGYVTRRMLEAHPELYDGGVEWEGVYWNPAGRHLMTALPVWVGDYPVYANWRGDRTPSERAKARDRMLEAGLHPASEPYWHQYFLAYWVVSLWLYGRNLDPDWAPFSAEWSNGWLQDPSPIARYPWEDRLGILRERVAQIANTGRIGKPLLSVAGNWDCLIPFRHHAAAYREAVADAGCAGLHRLYEVEGGNHVDGMLRNGAGDQQPVQPFYEAALHHLERWVEEGMEPPPSGVYRNLSAFWNGPLFSETGQRWRDADDRRAEPPREA
ncbi:alpha/beta hydrolase domain-containing protein [Alicyclobacillus sp.]|uniref:alpha/beta hydrolase domain-containing protein n=1 Tax=Alicyclobacillus sp. TaxID=61169 RepID=UPI0025BDB071|nr:alpha/beta hydrolase domain-containing protein [Alicyclobacillus sp.]MCL6517373.1 alpha/beta hydrolase [Alicyclobacillus sp.]